jgi:polysaccharide export outer membrane protein
MNLRTIFFRAAVCGYLFVSHLSAESRERGVAETSSYVIKPNDVIRLSVFDEPALSSQTKVLQTGEAMFPLIGPVKVAGLSMSDSMEKIRALYDADYVVEPKVTLTVDEYAVQQVSILGAVKSPGQIPIPASGTLDLSVALATAGGLSESADPASISLERANGQPAVLSLSAVQRGAKIQLAPGDRIIVAESRFLNKSVTFVGQVRTSGSISFPMDGDLDIVTAVARVGGFADLANPRKVSVNRKGVIIVVDVKDMTSKGAKIFKLEPDDIITVPERLF